MNPIAWNKETDTAIIPERMPVNGEWALFDSGNGRTAKKQYNEPPEDPVLTTYDITWTNIVTNNAPDEAVISLDLDYDDNGTNCVLLVVKAGSIESGKNAVTITASTDAPDATNAVPLYYANASRDPYLVSAEIDTGVITCSTVFSEPTYLYCTNESINRNQPYEVFKLNKPLHIRVVPAP